MPNTYSTGVWRGLPHYECFDCEFDSLEDEQAIIDHVARTGHGEVRHPLSIEDYISQVKSEEHPSVIITLAYLCWNTRKASAEGVEALYQEAARLHQLGCTVHLAVLDNGSDDGSYVDICEVIAENVGSHKFASLCAWKQDRNLGISKARNELLDFARTRSDFILLMDGDIEIVPMSSYLMARYLLCHPNVGCIGAYPANYTADRAKVAPYLFEIPECRVHSDLHCACTQYGLFRSSLFNEKKVRFDESGPLGQPGWGFEDDDMYWQIRQAGMECRYFHGMTYLHRALHSSWPSLSEMGLNPRRLHEERRDYVVGKWRDRGVHTGTMKLMESQQFPGGYEDRY